MPESKVFYRLTQPIGINPLLHPLQPLVIPVAIPITLLDITMLVQSRQTLVLQLFRGVHQVVNPQVREREIPGKRVAQP